MFKRLIFIIVVIITLVSCTKKTALSKPTNLRIENNILYWDSVKNASSYYVYIDDEVFTTNTNEYDLNNLPDGDYEIRVSAKGKGYLNSEKSDIIDFHLDTNYEIPTNLTINEKLLTWDNLADITKYTISINDELFEVTENKYDLTQLLENKLYKIKVKAHYGNNASRYSDEITYHTFFDLYKQLDSSFNKNTTTDLIINVEEELTITNIIYDDETVGTTNYSTIDTTLNLKNDYLQGLNYGVESIILHTSKGIIMINIQIIDDRKPSILSESNVKFSDKDLVFNFELYGGKIDSVTSTQEISESNYKIEGNKITIYKEYLSNIFHQQDAPNRVIFCYVLKANDNIIIGYLFVNRE